MEVALQGPDICASRQTYRHDHRNTSNRYRSQTCQWN